MSGPGFTIDETEEDAQTGGTGAEDARAILRACFNRLVDEALTYHTLDAQERVYWATMVGQQPGETLHDYRRRVRSGALEAGAPVVPKPAQSGVRITTGSGKSEAFRQAIATRYIPEAKRLQLPHRVLIAVPTHRAGRRGAHQDAGTASRWRSGRD